MSEEPKPSRFQPIHDFLAAADQENITALHEKELDRLCAAINAVWPNTYRPARSKYAEELLMIFIGALIALFAMGIYNGCTVDIPPCVCSDRKA
jgi:hypothetical protein